MLRLETDVAFLDFDGEFSNYLYNLPLKHTNNDNTHVTVQNGHLSVGGRCDPLRLDLNALEMYNDKTLNRFMLLYGTLLLL